MRPRAFTITNIQDDSATYYASNVTDLGAVTLSQTGTTDGLAHFVTTTNDAAANLGTTTLAVVGTDADGVAQSETITLGTDGTVVNSTKYYLGITSMTVGGVDPGASTFDIGISDDAVGPTIGLDHCSPYAAAIQVDTNSANVSWTIQEQAQNVYASSAPAQLTPWFPITALTAKTADTAGSATIGMTAIRFLQNSASDAVTDVNIYVVQPTRGG